ncbi:MAG: glycosyltransferase [Candidatus Riflebacteria bacterium]|nr:glycosyltransferase [Candidatus Riflebacteria bacterium]
MRRVDRPTTVLLLVSDSGLGGGQSVALWLATRLAATRQYQPVFGARAGGALEREVHARNLRFRAVSLGDGVDLAGLAKLVRLVRAIAPDLIHTHLNRAALWGSLAGRLGGVPVVASAHGLNRPIYYRFARRVLAVSRAVRDHLVERCPSLSGRVTVVLNALVPAPRPDPGRTAALKELLGLGPADRVLLVVGKLHPNKGQRLALQVVERLGPGHRLLLAGEGPDRTWLKEEIARRGIQRACALLGHRADVPDLLALADLALVPSASEAFSLAAAEAILAGVPVIASRIGGLPEALGGCGHLVDGLEPDTWARHCRTALARLPQERELVARERERLAAAHHPDRVFAQIETVYADLIPHVP